MKKCFLSFLIHTCCIITVMFAQKQLQGGLYFGGINYEGDLAPSSLVVSLSETHLDVGGFIYLKTNDWLALKINYHHGTLSGTDAKAHDEGRRDRNLHFKSPLDELSVSGVFFYPHKFQKKSLFKPFVTLGMGAFRFNPQANLNGKWYDLQPLSTEGQGLKNYPSRKPYSRLQICFPMGIGTQMALNRRVNLTFEFSFRKTLTDYIDDVSTTYVSLEDLTKERGDIAATLSNRTLLNNSRLPGFNGMRRGDSKNKDWYVIGSVGFVVNILGNSAKDNL